jgi:hypothetical protein
MVGRAVSRRSDSNRYSRLEVIALQKQEVVDIALCAYPTVSLAAYPFSSRVMSMKAFCPALRVRVSGFSLYLSELTAFKV